MTNTVNFYLTPIELTLDVKGKTEINLFDEFKKVRLFGDIDAHDIITDIQVSKVTMNKDYKFHKPRVNKPFTFNKWELPIICFRKENELDDINLFLNKEVGIIYLPDNVFYSITMLVTLKRDFNNIPEIVLV